MKRSKWFFHPVFVFIFSVLALGLSLFLYIYWYVGVTAGLDAIVKKFNLDRSQIFEPQSWVVIVVLSILVGIILTGIFIIFVYNLKTLQLYKLQNNFINNFTHELKTPVTSLKLYLETFLKYELLREDRNKYINYMLSDVGRLTVNINSILNLATIESKRYETDFTSADIVQTIKQFYNNNKHLFQRCEINISSVPDDDVLCNIDMPLFEILLMNLLNNAVKYNKSDTPKVDIKFFHQNGKHHLRFEDNGIGIEKKELKKIFKKFYQVQRPGDMSVKGSGLGLYLVGNIAKLHKWKIIAESEGPGKGSVFTVVIPR